MRLHPQPVWRSIGPHSDQIHGPSPRRLCHEVLRARYRPRDGCCYDRPARARPGSLAGADSYKVTQGLCHQGDYTLLGYLVTNFLPLGEDPAWRLNLLSAFFGALAVGLMYLVAHHVLARLSEADAIEPVKRVQRPTLSVTSTSVLEKALRVAYRLRTASPTSSPPTTT